MAINIMFNKSFTWFFGEQFPRQIPHDRDLIVPQQAARHLFGIAKVDLSASRTGSAESEAAKLQLR